MNQRLTNEALALGAWNLSRKYRRQYLPLESYLQGAEDWFTMFDYDEDSPFHAIPSEILCSIGEFAFQQAGDQYRVECRETMEELQKRSPHFYASKSNDPNSCWKDPELRQTMELEAPYGLYQNGPDSPSCWLRFFPGGDVTGEFDRTFQSPEEAREEMGSRYIGLYNGDLLCSSSFQLEGDLIQLHMEFERPIHPEYTHITYMDLWGTMQIDGTLHFHLQKIDSWQECIDWTFHFCPPD